MAIATGYDQLQPAFVLGTGQWVSSVAEQMVGADIDKVNQLRDHFPFYPLARGASIVIPRVAALGTAHFTKRQNPQSDDTITKLAEPAEEIEVASIEGTVNVSDYTIDVQSYSIHQLDLQIEFKKIAIRIAFWEQFFSSSVGHGFKGLPKLVDPSQLRAINRSLALADLDALVSRVTEADAEMDRKILVMNMATFVHYVALVRATESTMTYTTFNGRRYACHNGVPILVCDFIRERPGEGGQAVDVWCMTLGIEDNGVFGVVPEGVGDGGLVIENAQGAIDTASALYRIRWYCNVILGHQRGLAGLTDVIINGASVV